MKHHRPYRTVEQAERDRAAWAALVHGAFGLSMDPLPDEDDEPEPECPLCHGTLRVLADPPEPWRSQYWTDCWECM